MSTPLPQVTAPSGTPAFLVEHDLDETDRYATFRPAQGHARRRPKLQASQREARVSWFLTADQMAQVDAWFEATLIVGSLPFAARLVKQGVGFEWWRAFWAEPYTATPQKTQGGLVWRVSGKLILVGLPSATAPLSSELVVEFELPLTAQGTVQVSHDLAVEYSVPLLRGIALAVEYSLPLIRIVNTYRLREGGGFTLREGTGKRIRESQDGT